MVFSVGIDLGGTNIAAGVVLEDYSIIREASVPTKVGRPWKEIASDMANLVENLIKTCGLSKKDCSGVGIGSPGICNGLTGEVVYSNNLMWDKIPLCKEISKATGLPCRISNDANCAALGEVVAGAAKGHENAVLLTLGTGLGSGIVIDGEIFEGKDSAGAELGHTTLISGGAPCTCGRLGCCEAYASATALIRMAKEAASPGSPLDKDNLSAKDIYDLKAQGDEGASSVVRKYETYLGEVAVNVTNLFRPDLIIIGGGVSGQKEALTGPLNDYVRSRCFGKDRCYVTKVVTALLGNKAGLIGAAALGMKTQGIQPLVLAPAFKSYIWGGDKLKTHFHKKTSLSPLAETWELSCHKDGQSYIEKGPWKGKTLGEYVESNRNSLGEGAKSSDFPILIKLIDSRDYLSIQVHPNDDYARLKENSAGKAEMWYILESSENSGIYLGLKEKVTKETFRKSLENGTVLDLLNWQKTEKGQVYLIPPGTVHGMGPGLVIAEIQQNSNITYRLYDYSRKDQNGKPRQLHIEKALDAAFLDRPKPESWPKSPEKVPGGTEQKLVQWDKFDVTLLKVLGVMEGRADEGAFQSLLCVEGKGAIAWEDRALFIQKGSSLFLPSGMGDYSLAGDMEIIKTLPKYP